MSVTLNSASTIDTISFKSDFLSTKQVSVKGFPNPFRILFATGNLAQNSEYAVQGALRPTTELLQSIEDELWAQTRGGYANGYKNGVSSSEFTLLTNENENASVWEIGSTKKSKYDDDREDLEITVTIHIPREAPNVSHAQEICSYVKSHIGVQDVDTVVIRWQSLTDSSSMASEDMLNELMPFWHELERCVEEKSMKSLGVSGFSVAQLEQFLPMTRITPNIVQIGQSNLCNVPRAYQILAKQYGFEIHVQRDVSEILPQNELQSLVERYGIFSAEDSYKVELLPEWIVQYTVVAKSRVVLIDKGYLAMTEAVTQHS